MASKFTQIKSEFFGTRFRAFADSGAWIMIVIGLFLFSLRTPFAPDGFINFPVAVTVLQTLGLLFTVAGLMIFLSILMWPQISIRKLLDEIAEGNAASGIALAGLFVFNGLSFVAIILWMQAAFGGGVGV